MAQQIKDRVPVGVTPDGKQITVWVTGKDKATFYRNVGKTLIEYGLLETLGIQTVKPSVSDMQVSSDLCGETFQQYAEEWITQHRDSMRQNTIKGYGSILKAHLYPYFGNMLLKDITHRTVQQYFNKKKEMSKGTLSTHLAKLKTIFASAMEDGLITVNPAKNRNIRNPGKVLPKRDALTEEERQKIAKIMPDMEEMDARYMAICMYAGTRKSETLGLQWKHVQQEKIEMRQQCQVNNKSIILPPKSECGVRDIDIQNRLQPFLAQRGKDEEYLFGNGTNPLTKHAFEKMWKRINSHMEGIGISSHVLRHTFITECAENDVPVNVTQQMAGHSTPGITLGTYTHVTGKMKQNALHKLNSL